jgi:hypothetical protein
MSTALYRRSLLFLIMLIFREASTFISLSGWPVFFWFRGDLPILVFCQDACRYLWLAPLFLLVYMRFSCLEELLYLITVTACELYFGISWCFLEVLLLVFWSIFWCFSRLTSPTVYTPSCAGKTLPRMEKGTALWIWMTDVSCAKQHFPMLEPCLPLPWADNTDS